MRALCRHCRYWSKELGTELESVYMGECRVDSPVPDDEKGRMFPLTRCDDWCGQWQPSELGD